MSSLSSSGSLIRTSSMMDLDQFPGHKVEDGGVREGRVRVERMENSRVE